ncbi:hypothetical protein lerEdw1_020568, partial [Lerista edwardsae]
VKIMLIHVHIAESLGVTPTPDTTHFHEIVVDKQNFNHSVPKKRSTLKCGTGQYEHPNKSHCCIKCHPAFGQITITSCTTKHNTVCGCKVNQYQYRRPIDPDFFCKNCTACRNGTIIQQCTMYNDTICRCDRGFFLRTSDNTCSPCSSCSDGECKKDCDPLNSVKPQDSSASVQQPGESVPKTASGEEKTNDCLLEPNQKVVMLQQETTLVSLPSQLPDCVKSAGETQIPDSHAVLYTIVDHVPVSRWKEFVRRLGLTENTIERIQMEQRHVREAQYEMLRHWRLQAGHDATVERISSILNQMELSGCSEAIQEVLPKQL